MTIASSRPAPDGKFFDILSPRDASQFVKEGKFQRQADMVRLQAKFGETEARKIAAREARERRAAAEAKYADVLERHLQQL